VNERIQIEIELVRNAFPELEFRSEDLWARLPRYPLNTDIWGRDECEIAFVFPTGLPGQPPYGFWVRPGLVLSSGLAIASYAFPVVTPFGPDWGQFSWAPEDWKPSPIVTGGTNMLDWVRSFAVRLGQGA
jgi:hypothetical protein